MFNAQNDLFARLMTARRPGAEAAVSLRRSRVWHAPDGAEGNGADGPDPKTPDTPETGGQPDAASNGDGGSQVPQDVASLPAWAQTMIKDLRAGEASYRTKAKQVEDEKRRQEQAQLEANKEFEKLANTYKTELEAARPKAERVDALEAYIQQSVKSRVAALPSDVRGLVPEYDDPLKTLAWLDANATRLMPQRAPDLNAGEGGSGGGKNAKLTADEEAVARRMNITPEEYAKQKDKK